MVCGPCAYDPVYEYITYFYFRSPKIKEKTSGPLTGLGSFSEFGYRYLLLAIILESDFNS